MKQICKGCYKPNVPDYCSACRKKLFDGGKAGALLDFSLPERNQLDILGSYNKDRTLRDIRLEYALRHEGDRLAPAEQRGSHILKPVPTGIYERLNQLPENEHLTMQIAEQVYKMPVAPGGYISLADGSPAFITRRFDLSDNKHFIKKYALSELFEKEGEEFRCIEDIARLLKKYLAAYKPQIEHLFAITVFNYLFSNRGQALHHFSLVKTSDGEYILSPAYNLLCTELHEHREEDLLLTGEVFAADKSDDPYSQMLSLAATIGIVPVRAERILNIFRGSELRVAFLVGQSFLSEESKQQYLSLYHQRLQDIRHN